MGNTFPAFRKSMPSAKLVGRRSPHELEGDQSGAGARGVREGGSQPGPVHDSRQPEVRREPEDRLQVAGTIRGEGAAGTHRSITSSTPARSGDGRGSSRSDPGVSSAT